MGFQIDWTDDLLHFVADKLVEGESLEEAAESLQKKFPKRLGKFNLKALRKRLRGRVLQGAKSLPFFLKIYAACTDAERIEATINRITPKKKQKEPVTFARKEPTHPLDITRGKKIGRSL